MLIVSFTATGREKRMTKEDLIVAFKREVDLQAHIITMQSVLIDKLEAQLGQDSEEKQTIKERVEKIMKQIDEQEDSQFKTLNEK